MKRRKAIQNIALFSAGTLLMPACQFESIPVFENVPLEKIQYQLIDQLATAMLPFDRTQLVMPESITDFILTMINDCYAPKDIQKFLLGLNNYQQQLQEKYKLPFNQLELATQKEELNTLHLQRLAEVESAKEQKVALKDLEKPTTYFFDTLKHLSQRHFTSSEYFLSQIMDFEFIPSRFNGCVKV